MSDRCQGPVAGRTLRAQTQAPLHCSALSLAETGLSLLGASGG